MRYRKFDESGKFTHATPWNFEVKVKRKGKNQPTKKETTIDTPQEIYIILTEEASLEEIKAVQEKLLDLGVKLSLNNIEYNQNGKRIERISVTYEVGGNSGTASWKNSQSYNFCLLYTSPSPRD